MSNVTVYCFLASYAVAFGLECVRLIRRSALNRVLILIAVTAGLFAHTWYLWERSGQTNLPPLLSSSHDWMLVLTWLAALLYLVATLADRDLAVGVFVLPLVIVLIVAARFGGMEPAATLGHAEQLQQSLRSWGMLHASLLVFGIIGVVIGFVLSMMYVYQHHRLKHRQAMQQGLWLPSLETLSRFNWWAVVLSVPLLTLGMLTGVGLGLYKQGTVEEFSFGDPVVITSSLAWAVMVVLLIWLLRAGHAAGRQVAWRTIWACGFLLATLIGLQVLSSGNLFQSWHAAS